VSGVLGSGLKICGFRTIGFLYAVVLGRLVLRLSVLVQSPEQLWGNR
jgi:hypothetical protein